MNLFITGGASFVGRHLIEQLAPRVEKIYLLEEKKKFKRAKRRFEKNLKVQVVQGDITLPHIVEDEAIRTEICAHVTVILHMAGENELAADYGQCLLRNVGGTQNILSFSALFKRLQAFHYMSTLSVCGDFQGHLKEEDLELDQGFHNHFEKSKFDAEYMVRKWRFHKNIYTRIYRTGILIGPGALGREIPHYTDGPYYFFEILSKLKNKKLLLKALKYLPLPFEKKSRLPIIPMENCIDVLCNGLLKKPMGKKVRCYHLLAKDCPTVQEFMQDSFDSFGFSVNIIPLPQSKVNHVIMDKIGFPKDFSKSLRSKCLFDCENLEKDFATLDPLPYLSFKRDKFKTMVSHF